MPLNQDSMEEVFIHPTSIVDENVKIGQGTKIWHFSHIISNTRIGYNCNIGQNVVAGPDVIIGDGCKIQNNVSLYKGVTLENNVFCGPSMVFTNVFNPRSHIRRMDELRPTLVRKGASLGANCTIICGVTIGKYAFIGAGAVVTKDVEDYALVMGNPAKQTGWMCECGEKLDKGMNCPVCNNETEEVLDLIPFVDLAAQQKKILPLIKKNIQTVLKHGKYIMGPEINVLEDQLAKFTGVSYAITCASGTDALLMALMASDIGPGDAVFTTSFTFIASAEVIKLLGATPVFVDIDKKTFNISTEILEEKIRSLVKSEQLIPKAIVPVDLFGLPCDYDRINEIALKYNLAVIEDAAQSFGGEYKGKKTGALGHIACTSFFPAKPLGCYGDGGAVFTESNKIAKKLLSIRVHGKGKNKYDNVCIGINGRMDTLQAAILLPKLEIFPEEITKRDKAAELYTALLSEKGEDLILPKIPEGHKSVWAQYSILAKDNETRKMIQNYLKTNKVPTAVYYPIPLHLQTAFADLKYSRGDFPESEDCASRIFSIPMHPYLSEKEQSRICSLIKMALA